MAKEQERPYRVALDREDARLLSGLFDETGDVLDWAPAHTNTEAIREQLPKLAARLTEFTGPDPVFSMTRVERMIVLLALSGVGPVCQ